MLTIEGKLLFDPVNVSKKHQKQSSWKKVALVMFNDDLDHYYAWFLQKRFNLVLNPPLRGSHVTIISDMVDNETYEQAHPFFNGKTVRFEYNPADIRTNGEHWWLRVASEDTRSIRTSMGLSADPYFSLHMTIGYANDKNIAHSKYILDCIKRHSL